MVVDPRKSISLHPQIPSNLSRLPKHGEESSGRREGSHEDLAMEQKYEMKNFIANLILRWTIFITQLFGKDLLLSAK